MSRKLVLVPTLILAILPNAAAALGLGAIHSQSALNEAFSGQIDLLDVSADELDAVKASLAPEAEFNKVGTPRPYFLTKLRFQPQVSRQGRPIILVTTSGPVREPYLDFLVEVVWPKGRLVKEYTVLLDPPVTLGRRPPRVDQPVSESRAPRLAAGEGLGGERRIGRPPASVDASAFPMRHGPVAPGSGLWRIARDIAPSGATIAQTAMAFYRNNQDAFIGGNINRLKVDEILDIPTAAELFALDQETAEREFATALRGGSVTSAPLTDVAAAPAPESRLEIATASQPNSEAPGSTQGLAAEQPAGTSAALPPGSGAPSAPASAATDSRADGTSEAGAQDPELGPIEQELLLVQEAGESARQEAQELRNRVRELEGQLADIQRLLTVSNERFAELQQSASGDAAEAGAGEGVQPAPEVGQAEREPLEESPKLAAALEPESLAPTDSPQDSASESAGQADAETPVPTTSFWSSFSGSMLSLSLLVPLLLLAFGWMILRRRRSLEESWELGELDIPAESAAVAAAGLATPWGEEDSRGSDDSIQVPTSDSGFAQLEEEADEDDIVSEADVYIAYGRYREAEALLEGEVSRSPERLDVKFKLADTYFAARNTSALEDLVEQMRGLGVERINPAQWDRVRIMLRDLKGPDADADEEATLQGVALNDSAQPQPAMPGQESSSIFPPPMSHDDERHAGEELASQGGSLESQPSTSHQSRDTLDLDLDFGDFDTLGKESAMADAGLASETSPQGAEFELDLDDLQNLEDLEFDSDRGSVPLVESMPIDGLTENLEEPDMESIEITPVGKDSSGVELEPSQWTESGGWDEASTKLDLARAYIEMDDPEAAQLILDEVVQEGSESQQAAAREMLDKLG